MSQSFHRGFTRPGLGAVAFFLVLIVAASPTLASPQLPGVARLLGAPAERAGGGSAAGEALLSELRCSACHVVPKAAGFRSAPPLANIGSRVLPSFVRAFLTAPNEARPGTVMPDVLAQLPASEREAAADDLTHYLFAASAPELSEPEWGDLQARDEGRALFSSLGCVACHGAPDPAQSSADHDGFISLAHLPRKTTASALKRFLADPSAVRPHTRMPNFRLSEGEQQALTMFLLREQLPKALQDARRLHRSGVRYEYFEGPVREGPPDWAEMRFVRKGVMERFELPPNIRNTKLALRQSALVDVPREGTYSFFSESNDGSELWVDGQLVVNNHGFHGPVEAAGTIKLTAGLHQIEVLFWQDEGGKALKVSWQGSGMKKAVIPADVLLLPGSVAMKAMGEVRLAVDAAKAARGRTLFGELGCASCHEPATRIAGSQRLLPLSPRRLDEGCLAQPAAEGVPHYELTSAQREALRRAVQAPARTSPKAQAMTLLAVNNCLACHERNGVGGVPQALNAHFGQTVEVDLGEEGRMPPSLTAAGEKLRVEAIRRIVGRGELHVRPYMSARMPVFPLPEADALAKALSRADGGRPQVPGKMPVHALEEGRRLLGTSGDMARTGFGCINCHNVAMRPAVGSPGPDLELAPVRLNYGWFDKWLAHPQSIRSDTRMPAFWGEVPLFPDVAGGSAKRQRAAIWGYLSAGATPLPEGLALTKQKAELSVGSEPIVYRTFMKEVGPRAIVVGNPEMVHVAFDANGVRMAKAWRGRFWDPSGTWTGRAGEFNEPLGDHVLDLPPGPAFAFLPSAAAPWPRMARDTRNVGGRFLGYHLDEQRRPVFRYDLQGTELAEVARPRRTPEGFSLVRSFTIKAPQPQLYFLAASGKRIEGRGEGKYLVEDRVEVRLPSALQKGASVRGNGDVQQLLLKVPEHVRQFDVEVRW